MRHENVRRQIFSRRALIAVTAKLGMLTGLGGYLHYLQWEQRDRFRSLSDDNRIRLVLVPPTRGKLLDRNGAVLAKNDDNYQLYFDPTALHNPAEISDVLQHVSEISGLDVTDFTRRIRYARKRRMSPPFLIADMMSWQQLSKLEVHAPDLPGVHLQAGDTRRYIYGEHLGHLLGHVGLPTPDEQKVINFSKRLPDVRIGKLGAEEMFDASLRGSPGLRQMEVNAHGHAVREWIQEPEVNGQDVALTIDMRVQQDVYPTLVEQRSASAILMDLHTGEIRGLWSVPSYDSAVMSRRISTEEWKALQDNPDIPLLNKAIAGQYPPGSTFKMLVALAALEEGVMSPYKTVYCPGHMQLGKQRFHCWKRHGHGSMNVHQAIMQSCDVYFYTVALELGIEKIAAMARRFGLGSVSGMGMKGEMPGLIPDKEWKQARHKESWQRGDTVNSSIGQGFVLATPMQLMQMVGAMANGGKLITPRLTALGADEVPEMHDVGVKQEHLDIVRKAMEAVSNDQRGTAYWNSIRDKGMEMGGKTGTSQVRRLSAMHKLPVHEQERLHRHHALFVGFAPIHNPRFATAVVVEHGGSGSAAAAPVARDILKSAQKWLLETEGDA